MDKNRIGRVWLITSESRKKPYSKVVSILKYQKSGSQIMEHITQLYIDSLYPSEKISFLKNRGTDGINYKPKLKEKDGKASISIGHEPYLYARKVINLRVNNEQLTWDEL